MRKFFSVILTLPCLLLGITGRVNAEQIYVVGSAFIGGTTTLFSFDSATPGTINSSTPITGVALGDSLRSIDFRPATGQLYGVSFMNQVYIINSTTGVATRLFDLGIPPFLSQPATGVDFDPVADRLRAVTFLGNFNRLANADTGETTAGSPLTYPAGDPSAGRPPRVAGLAYTNSFAGAASTRLFGIDTGMGTAFEPGRGSLFTQDLANPGTITTVGFLGVNTNSTELVGFDISGSTGMAYAVLTVGGLTSPNFYTINLNTGAATLIGPPGTSGFVISGLAVAPTQAATIPEPATLLLLGTGLAAVGAAGRKRCKASKSEDG